MAFTSKSLLVFPAQPNESFRLCFIEDGPLLGRAYSQADVDRLIREHGVSTVNYMTGGKSFPGGPNIDEEIAQLSQDLLASDSRLGQLERGSDEYLAEAELNREICQQMLQRTCLLAGLTDLDRGA